MSYVEPARKVQFLLKCMDFKEMHGFLQRVAKKVPFVGPGMGTPTGPLSSAFPPNQKQNVHLRTHLIDKTLIGAEGGKMVILTITAPKVLD